MLGGWSLALFAMLGGWSLANGRALHDGLVHAPPGSGWIKRLDDASRGRQLTDTNRDCWDDLENYLTDDIKEMCADGCKTGTCYNACDGTGFSGCVENCNCNEFYPSPPPSPPPPSPSPPVPSPEPPNPPEVPLPPTAPPKHDDLCNLDSIVLCTDVDFGGVCTQGVKPFSYYVENEGQTLRAWGADELEAISSWVVPSLTPSLGGNIKSIRVGSGCLVRLFQETQDVATHGYLPSEFMKREFASTSHCHSPCPCQLQSRPLLTHRHWCGQSTTQRPATTRISLPTRRKYAKSWTRA